MYSNRKREHSKSMIQTVSTPRQANKRQLNEDSASKRLAFKGKISQIPNLISYIGQQKLKLGKQTLQKIKRSLDIQHQSQLYYQQRVKLNNFYINYEKDPFIIEPVVNIGETKPKQMQNSKGHKDKDIVESISRLKEKTQFRNIMNRLVKEDSQSNQIHRKMKDAARNQEIARKIQRYVEKEVNEKENLMREDIILTPFEDFDQIINMKDENFYRKHNKNRPVNIFKIMTGGHQDSYLTYAKLKKVYFCQDSTISKANSKKITNVFKDISFVSRLFITNYHHKIPKEHKLVPADIKCILDQINYADVMNLASGIIQPEVLEAYLYEEVRNTGKKSGGGGDEEGSSFVQDKRQILYEDIQQNKSTIFRVQRHDRAQIQTYINHPFSKIEKKQQMLSQVYREKLLKYVNLEKQFKSINIRDDKLLSEISDKKKEIMIEMYEGQIKKQSGSIDKVIRLNKRNKDRIENVKNKVVIETVQKVKQIEKQMRSSSRQGNSLSKWR